MFSTNLTLWFLRPLRNSKQILIFQLNFIRLKDWSSEWIPHVWKTTPGIGLIVLGILTWNRNRKENILDKHYIAIFRGLKCKLGTFRPQISSQVKSRQQQNRINSTRNVFPQKVHFGFHDFSGKSTLNLGTFWDKMAIISSDFSNP